MKKRNKKTGKVQTCDFMVISDDISRDGEIAKLNSHVFIFRSIEQLNEEFEDYKPAEPLIKDEKIRKAVRAWLAIQGQPIVAAAITCNKDSDGFFNYCLYGYIEKARISNGKPVVNNNLTAIDFEFRSLEKMKFERHRDYTIAELCGEATDEA